MRAAVNKVSLWDVSWVALFFICFQSCVDHPLPLETRKQALRPLSGPERLCWDAGVGYDLCYQNPSFGVGNFAAVHGVAGGVTWFAQGGHLWGTALGQFPLHLEYQNGQAELLSVYALSDVEAWAVGNVRTNAADTRPLVLHWSGNRWVEALLDKAMEVGLFLRAVHAVNGVVWVLGTTAGTVGQIWSFREGVWKHERTEQATLYSMWGVEEKNVWVVGLNGFILHWDGSVWTRQDAGIVGSLHAMWGSDAENVWAVGDGGVIAKWNGTKWASQSVGTVSNFNGIWGSDAENVWAVGDGGVIVKWDGGRWISQSSGTENNLNGIWGSDARNVWAVGDGGVVVKWDGARWEMRQPLGLKNNLNAVWGSGPNSVLVAGNGGTLLRWNGTGWAPALSGMTSGMNAGIDLKSIFGTGGGNVWVVGSAGTVWWWNGAEWSVSASKTKKMLFSGWASAVNSAWSVGENGTIVKWDGTQWVPQSAGTMNHLRGVWGSDVNTVWTVGDGGTMLRWNNVAWTSQHSFIVGSLKSIWGLDRNNFWVLGQSGVVLKCTKRPTA